MTKFAILQPVLVLIGVFSFFEVGILIDFYLLNKKKLLGDLAIFFGLGIGFIGLFEAATGILNIKINQTFVVSLFLLATLPFIVDKSLARDLRKLIVKTIKALYKSNTPYKLLTILFLLSLGGLFIQTFSHNIWGSDAYSFWLSKASAFFIDQKITRKNLFLYWPYDHPLLWPAAATWLYHFIGSANEFYFQIVPFAIYILITLSFYKNLKKGEFINQFIWTAVLSLTPFLWTNVVLPDYVGNADLLVSFYLLLVTINLINKKFIYAGLFLFFAGLTKNDAVPSILGFLIFFPIIILLKEKRWRIFINPWLWVLFLFIAHLIWRTYFGLTSRYLENLLDINLSQRPFLKYMWYTANAFREEARQTYRWGIGWWLIIFIIIFNIKKIFKNRVLFLTLLILSTQFLSYFVIYYITPEDQASQIATSIFRLILQLYPAALFLAYKVSYNK